MDGGAIEHIPLVVLTLAAELGPPFLLVLHLGQHDSSDCKRLVPWSSSGLAIGFFDVWKGNGIFYTSLIPTWHHVW